MLTVLILAREALALLVGLALVTLIVVGGWYGNH